SHDLPVDRTVQAHSRADTACLPHASATRHGLPASAPCDDAGRGGERGRLLRPECAQQALQALLRHHTAAIRKGGGSVVLSEAKDLNFRQYARRRLSYLRAMHLYCHDHPETLTLETEVADARPGKIALADTPFYPGGGGQLADRGLIRWAGGEVKVTGFDVSAGKLWHLLDTPGEVTGRVEAVVDPDFRRRMRQLHTS